MVVKIKLHSQQLNDEPTPLIMHSVIKIELLQVNSNQDIDIDISKCICKSYLNMKGFSIMVDNPHWG